LRVAIVHEWFITYAGSERVLEQILDLYPQADLFAIVDFLNNDERKFLKNKEVKTSFIQKLPFAKTKYKNYLFLMPIAVEQFDLSEYDLIISNSHAVAKGILTSPSQLHICMCHSPIRYAWDLQHQYLKESNLKGIKLSIARLILHYMRIWDYRTSFGVNEFIANSKFISGRIKKVYGRDSTVIYPPVDTEKFILEKNKKSYYLTVSRFVPYKKIDLIAEAFSKMPDRELIIIGNGSEYNKIKEKCSQGNIKLLGYQSTEVIINYMKEAKAFIFAAEEDFGIVPVESQSCGTPVIAFSKGGTKETVIPYGESNPTGIFFDKQDVESIINAVKYFDNININSEDCRQNSLKYNTERFKREFKNFVDRKIKSHQIVI
jgi:glycosyltransferase involved in cell wall biosynthesis